MQLSTSEMAEHRILIIILCAISVAGDWKPCTRNCDVGVATRNMVCGTQITVEQVEFCEVQHCPGCFLKFGSLSCILLALALTLLS